MHVGMAGTVDQPPACCGKQPCLWLIRHAAARPSFQRRLKGIRERIFRRCHVARACGEKSDQTAVRIARHLFDRAARVHFHFMQLEAI